MANIKITQELLDHYESMDPQAINCAMMGILNYGDIDPNYSLSVLTQDELRALIASIDLEGNMPWYNFIKKHIDAV
jgi:hypothetical protein